MLSEKDIQARDALEGAIRAGGEGNRFWAVRAMTIQSYASFEQALGDLFAWLSDTNPQVAGIIFFRLNAATRLPILEKLFQHKFRTEYNLFRNSLMKALRPLDNERNEIVHWNVINNIIRNDDGTMTGTLDLEPPTLWSEAPVNKRWVVSDLEKFMDKARFYSEVVRMFTMIVLQRGEALGYPTGFHDAWRDIFLQPIVYPPPADHPSLRFRRNPATPSPSSQG